MRRDGPGGWSGGSLSLLIVEAEAVAERLALLLADFVRGCVVHHALGEATSVARRVDPALDGHGRERDQHGHDEEQCGGSGGDLGHVVAGAYSLLWLMEKSVVGRWMKKSEASFGVFYRLLVATKFVGQQMTCKG
uniref:Uncharacterized protein n=1 Tax=Kalanchoe fedtschenkoi TaxID=63787 RepID=A0A7N0SXW0_KALFE